MPGVVSLCIVFCLATTLESAVLQSSKLETKSFFLDISSFSEEGQPITCISSSGMIDPECSSGWKVTLTDPSGKQSRLMSPTSFAIMQAGLHLLEIDQLSGWSTDSILLDGTPLPLASNTLKVFLMHGNHSIRLIHRQLPVTIRAKAFFDANKNEVFDSRESAIPSMTVCLHHSISKTPVTSNWQGARLLNIDEHGCQRTDSSGQVLWDNIRAGSYLISNPTSSHPGLRPTTSSVEIVTLHGNDVHTVSFGSIGACKGLSVDYWSRWQQIYTSEQFSSLLAGILSNLPADQRISVTDTILAQYDPSMTSINNIRALVFANLLTLQLTQYTNYTNPTSGSLYDGCEIAGFRELGSLRTLLTSALNMLQNQPDGSASSDDDVASMTSILSSFAGQKEADSNRSSNEDRPDSRSKMNIVAGFISFAMLATFLAMLLALMQKREGVSLPSPIKQRNGAMLFRVEHNY